MAKYCTICHTKASPRSHYASSFPYKVQRGLQSESISDEKLHYRAINVIKYKPFFIASTHWPFHSSFLIKPICFIELYHIQSILPTSQIVSIVFCFFCFPSLCPSDCSFWNYYSAYQSVQTPTVSNWQCSKLSPTLSADIALYSCLLVCS